MNRKRLAALTVAVVAACGLAVGIPAVMAASPVPAAGNLYACVDGANRVVEHAYTVPGNFQGYLDGHGGTCPNGFPVAIGVPATSTPTPTPSTTSPTPTPTATTPTPTATSPAPGAPLYTLSALNRSQTPQMPAVSGGSNDGGAAVRQEVWNLKPALHKQFTEVWSPSHWQTTINAAAGNTEVNSYPDVSDTVTTTSNTPVPFANYASLSSTYAEDMHATAGTDAEAAYDIWLGDSAHGQYAYELMIWVDNHGQRPAGNNTGSTLAAGGVTYQVWADNGGFANSVVSLVQPNAKSGSADIRGIIAGLIAAGRYPAGIGVNQVNFGFEAPSTGGADEVFEVTGYTLAATAVAGKVV